MKSFLLIFSTVTLAGLLRIVFLSSIPVSLSHDEVAIGYNAWSILKTGMDEYGNFFPILFRSFDDFKLPGYIYTTVISEAVFGLTPFALRFPSAFFGTLTVLVLFFLIKEFVSVMPDKEKRRFFYLPYITSFLLAISPWHINFSRGAFESNVSVFFIVLTVYFLLVSRRKPIFIILAGVTSITSVYFYYTARIVVPLIVITFLIMNRKTVVESKRFILTSFIVSLILLLPIFPHMFTSGLSRVNQVSIFEDKSLTNPYSESIVRNNNALWAKVVYNRRIAYLQQFSDNYLKNFSFDFYFTNGTGPMGLLYLWQLPFFLLGVYSLLKLKTRQKWIIVVWFLSVPIVGGLTVQQPNALRTLPNAPTTALISGLGVVSFFWYMRNVLYKKLAYFTVAGLMVISFIQFLILYFDYQVIHSAERWGDGHKQMAQYVAERMSTYDHIIVTGANWRPYTYLLFYMNYDPKNFINEKGSKNGFANIQFGKAGWDHEGITVATLDLSPFQNKKTLVIMTAEDLASQRQLVNSGKRPYTLKVIGTIDGQIVKNAFYAVEI